MLRLENLRDVDFSNRDPVVIKGMACQGCKRPPVPRYHRRHEFGHHHPAFGAESVQCRGQGVPHAQPSDQDLGTGEGGDSCTGELSHSILRTMDTTIYEFGTVHPDRELSTALV